MQLELTEEERRELLEMVKTAYANTNPELHRAHSHAAHVEVHHRRELLERLLARLGEPQSAAA